MGGCPVNGERVNSIPPPTSCHKHPKHTPVVTIKKYLQTLPYVPWEVTLICFKNHWFRLTGTRRQDIGKIQWDNERNPYDKNYCNPISVDYKHSPKFLTQIIFRFCLTHVHIYKHTHKWSRFFLTIFILYQNEEISRVLCNIKIKWISKSSSWGFRIISCYHITVGEKKKMYLIKTIPEAPHFDRKVLCDDYLIGSICWNAFNRPFLSHAKEFQC